MNPGPHALLTDTSYLSRLAIVTIVLGSPFTINLESNRKKDMRKHLALITLLFSYRYSFALSVERDALSRRHFGSSVVGLTGFVTGLVDNRNAALAGSLSQEEIDKTNILKGYDRLTFLLDNWVKETTICGNSDNPYIGNKGCERTPLKVMDYLGYKNVKDPLFKADKTMARLEPLVPQEKETEYLEAIEKWIETADEASSMAFVSSWGEANPGGGQDRVELFIERAKNNVIDARDSLRVVVDILGLKP